MIYRDHYLRGTTINAFRFHCRGPNGQRGDLFCVNSFVSVSWSCRLYSRVILDRTLSRVYWKGIQLFDEPQSNPPKKRNMLQEEWNIIASCILSEIDIFSYDQVFYHYLRGTTINAFRFHCRGPNGQRVDLFCVTSIVSVSWSCRLHSRVILDRTISRVYWKGLQLFVELQSNPPKKKKYVARRMKHNSLLYFVGNGYIFIWSGVLPENILLFLKSH